MLTDREPFSVEDVPPFYGESDTWPWEEEIWGEEWGEEEWGEEWGEE